VNAKLEPTDSECDWASEDEEETLKTDGKPGATKSEKPAAVTADMPVVKPETPSAASVENPAGTTTPAVVASALVDAVIEIEPVSSSGKYIVNFKDE